MEQVNPSVATLYVIVGLQVLVTLAGSIVQIVMAFRRTPPIDQTLSLYARSVDLAQIEERNNKTHAEIFAVIRTLQTSSEKTFSDVQRMLGRVEGQLAEISRGGGHGHKET